MLSLKFIVHLTAPVKIISNIQLHFIIEPSLRHSDFPLVFNLRNVDAIVKSQKPDFHNQNEFNKRGIHLAQVTTTCRVLFDMMA